MDFVRTPDERFAGLAGFAFEPHYVEVGGLRMHYLDEGPASGPVVLMLHGEPSWSYLYRKMVGPFVAAGYRTVVPDLIGFGRSDKPVSLDDYSYASHLSWTRGLLDALKLDDITLFCQDWGGLLGLRMVAEQPERFSRVIAANTFMPTGDQNLGKAFHEWKDFTLRTPSIDVGRVIDGGTATELTAEVIAAYDAPFPDDTFKAGVRKFPSLVPATPDDPETPANRAAWQSLMKWDRPVLTLFGDSDPVTRGAEKALQHMIPGAKGQPHAIIESAGHFIQEDQGEEPARLTIAWLAGL